MSKKLREDSKGRELYKGETQREDGSYVYKYIGADGKPKYESSWRLTKADKIPKGKRKVKPLREIEKEIQRDLMDGINSTGAEMTVSRLFQKHTELNPNVRESTKKGRVQLLNILQSDKIGNMKIKNVKPSDAKAWAIRMKEKGYAYQTIYNHKRFLKAIFYTAMQDDFIRKNPFNWNLEDVIENDTESKIALTNEQADKLLSFSQTDKTYRKLYNVVMLLLNTGLRISELCGLEVKDIDFENGYIHVSHQLIFENGTYRIEPPKTKAGVREIPMTDFALKAIKDEMQNRENAQPVKINGHSDFIFLNKKGLPMYGVAYATEFSAMIKKYNKHNEEQLPKISPHILRHTFCTNMAKNKELSPADLQKIMGHESIVTTLGYYAHGSSESAKSAITTWRG
ncbi:MAG: tyrosine-type recombinase/integrase [Lachnospiraceae bacterium]|jgi:integrase|nr:tyrosine-type recombinase/integrase [Lachnospiraceae bacterium]